MTTLTINIPDSNKRVISDITKIASSAGYELLIDAYKEALLIKMAN